MRFTLTIDCDNAAFEGDPLTEVARILHVQATKMVRFAPESEWNDTLLDLNGNRVGRARMEDEDEDLTS
jgi:hypothetical protein